ncbi:MAG: hypothetical protein ACO3TG_00935 [Minisyncoccia bacterium]
MLYIKSKFEFISMSSFKAIIAGTMLAATASLGVITPDAKATPSPGEDWAYVTNAEPCIPQFSVSDNIVDNTIRVQVQDNTCQISREIYLYIQDDRPQPLRLKATYSQGQTWTVNYNGVRPGRYRVMGISPTPTGIGDYNYVSSRDLGIDQVITIGVVGSRHPVADPPPVSQTQQGITTLDPESKQLLRNFAQWMHWLKVQMDWLKANLPQLEPLIRAVESIKTS